MCGRETENNLDGCCEKNTQDATFKGDIGWPKFWVFSSQGCEIGYLVTSAPSGLAGVQVREFISPGCNQNCQFLELVKCQGGVSKQLSCNSSSAELALMSCSLAAVRTLVAKLQQMQP